MITFDTNILIYAADPRVAKKQQLALDLLLHAENGILLWQVACEFLSVSRKLAPHGFTREEAWDQLSFYLRTFPLTTPTKAVLQRARILHGEKKWSFWDAMIVGACLEAGVRRLYSEDLPGSMPPAGIEIVNPFA